MRRAQQIVIVINIVDVGFIRVTPARRQRLGKAKPIAVILEARMAGHNYRAIDAEPVFAPKVRAKMLVWNTAMMMFFMRYVTLVVSAVFHAMIVFVPVIVSSSVIVSSMVVLCHRRNGSAYCHSQKRS